jgi:hypothetical protein
MWTAVRLAISCASLVVSTALIGQDDPHLQAHFIFSSPQ